MRGRLFTIVVAMVVFLLVAFTPIVSLMLQYYGVTDAFLVKTVIGLLTLGCGYFFVSAILNRDKKPKEGERAYRVIPLLIGAALIMLAWYTDLPSWLAEITGTNHYLATEVKELVPIGTRIWVSVLTLLGIVLIKVGFYRTKEEDQKGKKTKKIGKGKRQEEDDDELYNTINKMGDEDD